MGGRHRTIVAVALVVVMVSPALRDHDSFPLSTYPIYASARPRTATFGTVIGELADGSWRRLPMSIIASTDDPLIAADRVADAIDDGRSEDLCAEVARRAPDDVAVIVVVSERHDVVATAQGRDVPLERIERARCAVPS
jgi:hypothetical protein